MLARKLAALAVLLLVGANACARAAEAARGGTLTPEPATPSALAVRWAIRGDSNANATVAVAYRRKGDEHWRDGYPLFRTYPDRVSPDNLVKDGWLFAGSVIDLDPGTDYELRLALADPDGGNETRRLTLRTATEPRAPADLRVLHVVPRGADGAAQGSGGAQDPFRGLRAALATARPGDLLRLAPGTYAESALRPNQAGNPARPIVIRGNGDGVVLDGGGAPLLIDLASLSDIWVENVTLRNAQDLVRADRSHRIVIRGNRIDLTGRGVVAHGAIYKEATGFFITDNEFVGTTEWPRARGIEGVLAINITGSGHVVAYNRITRVADGIHNGDNGRQSAMDIYNNEIELATDDGIETDYSDTNVRVFRNRITNAFSGISGQPVYGGPVYVFRNTILNTQYSPFKLHNDMAGMLLFHNTSVKAGSPFVISPANETVRDVVTRNNLFVGTGGPALRTTGQMQRCDFDNDGYSWSTGSFATWNGKTFASPLAAKMDGAIYTRLGAIALPSWFLFASGLFAPTHFAERRPSAANDPTLAEGSAAIDKGVLLPNFNDGFRGKAPDLGCCEAGEPVPHYGPRPKERRPW